MRRLGFAGAGLFLGAALALLMGLVPTALARAADPQGLHLMGVIFLLLPGGGFLGLVLGLAVERLTRKGG